MQNESIPWKVMSEVFKCSVREIRHHLISQTEHLNTSDITSHGTDSFRVKPITPGHPQDLNYFVRGYLKDRVKQSTDKRGHHQKRKTDSTRNAQ